MNDAIPDEMPDAMLERYSRHILLSEIDEEGQRKLLNAHLVCVGLGGLAASALPLLAGAGIGKITLIDGDRVDISNLSRQTLYNEQMVGAPKALCAAETLSNLNSEIAITPINQLLSSDNSDELLKNADIIIDATDNFPARYRINAVACKHKIAFASASLMRFGGQISFFKPHFTENNITLPCYQCLYPQAPPENLLPRCDELGIFSPTASLFGVMLASEALKYLIGCGTLLTGRLLMLECDDWQWQNISFSHRADCANNHSK